jgi:hypothetical protein
MVLAAVRSGRQVFKAAALDGGAGSTSTAPDSRCANVQMAGQIANAAKPGGNREPVNSWSQEQIIPRIDATRWKFSWLLSAQLERRVSPRSR